MDESTKLKAKQAQIHPTPFLPWEHKSSALDDVSPLPQSASLGPLVMVPEDPAGPMSQLRPGETGVPDKKLRLWSEAAVLGAEGAAQLAAAQAGDIPGAVVSPPKRRLPRRSDIPVIGDA